MLIQVVFFTMEGWRSGQSQQTVNLPSLALRWFKSSSLHHFFLCFGFLLCVSLQTTVFSATQNISLNTISIEQQIDFFLEHETLSFSSSKSTKLLKSFGHYTFFLLNKEASTIELFFSTYNLYKFFYQPNYYSNLLSITTENAPQKIPFLIKKLRKKRIYSAWFKLASGIGLGIYSQSDSLNSDKMISLSSVSVDLISSSIVQLFYKSHQEKFLENLAFRNQFMFP